MSNQTVQNNVTKTIGHHFQNQASSDESLIKSGGKIQQNGVSSPGKIDAPEEGKQIKDVKVSDIIGKFWNVMIYF